MAEVAKEKSSRGSFFGSKKKDPEGAAAEPVDVDAETDKASPKNWLGMEKKKPRAEYQEEIDALKAKLEELLKIKEDRDAHAARVRQLTMQANEYKMWARRVPSLEMR